MAEVRLLGVVELRAANRALGLGPPKQRAVFAALAVDAGRAVRVDTLVDRVWGDAPPAEARNALYAHIMRIRRLLGPVAAADGSGLRLDRRPGGYLLDIDRECVDLHRFQRLVDQAREDGREDSERVVLLRDALALWRDTPMADLSGAWFARRREGWRQHWLNTLVTLARTGLRLGNHDAVIDRLQDIILDLRGETRTAPQERITAGRTSGQVPRQLPAPPQMFTGRTRELAVLDRIHDATEVVISTIDGMAGVGKTALAVHTAHRIAHRYPHGQLFIDLHGYTRGMAPREPAEALDHLLRALGVPDTQIPADVEERAALYRTRLADKSTLILLDNAATEAQVAPLLPGAAGHPSSTTTLNIGVIPRRRANAGILNSSLRKVRRALVQVLHPQRQVIPHSRSRPAARAEPRVRVDSASPATEPPIHPDYRSMHASAELASSEVPPVQCLMRLGPSPAPGVPPATACGGGGCAAR